MQSGLEILFDDAAEDLISLSLQTVTLEKAIKNILKGHNVVMHYDNDANQKQFMTSITVLPRDKHDSRHAKRLLSLNSEAYNRSLSQLSQSDLNKIDLAKERWQSRLKNMSPQRRQEIEARVTKRIIADSNRKKKQAEKRAENKKRQERLTANHNRMQEQALQHLSPEQRAEIEQRNIDAHNQIKNQLLIQLDKNSMK